MTDLLPDLESQLERYGALLRDELARSVPAVALDRRHASLPRLVLAAAVIVFVALVGAAVVVSRPSRPAGRTPTTRPTSTSTTIAPGQPLLHSSPGCDRAWGGLASPPHPSPSSPSRSRHR